MGAAIQAAVYGVVLETGNWNAVFISIAAFCVLIAIVSFAGSRKQK
jgi:sugar phosphate permease